MSTKAEGKNSILLKSALQNHPYPMLGLWKVKAKDNDGKICFPTLTLPNHILSYAKIAKIYQYNKQQQQPFISFHHTVFIALSTVHPNTVFFPNIRVYFGFSNKKLYSLYKKYIEKFADSKKITTFALALRHYGFRSKERW